MARLTPSEAHAFAMASDARLQAALEATYGKARATAHRYRPHHAAPTMQAAADAYALAGDILRRAFQPSDPYRWAPSCACTA